MPLELLESLKNNKAISFVDVAKNWEEAILLCFKPLIKCGAIEKQYLDSIIKSVKKNGPYFIISNEVAMPHSRPEDGVVQDCFSLLILKKPVQFPGDNRMITILIGLGATSNDIHVGRALPQVVAVFEDDSNVAKIQQTKTVQEVCDIISKININKYIS